MSCCCGRHGFGVRQRDTTCTVRKKLLELILEINKTVIVASRWFLYYLTYIDDDARSNTNQVYIEENLCITLVIHQE